LRRFVGARTAYRPRKGRTAKRETAVKKILHRVWNIRQRRDEGASAVEYGLLVALIAVIIVGAVAALGSTLTDKFNDAECSVSTGEVCGGEEE
jgi:Flp pilus assembly pilin Flp